MLQKSKQSKFDGFINRLLLPLAYFSISKPRLVVTIFAIIIGVVTPGIFKLTLNVDGRAMVPKADPVFAFDQEVREKFDLRDPIIILINSTNKNGIFNTQTLLTVKKLTATLLQLPTIDQNHIMSLATEVRDRFTPITLKYDPYLKPFPDTPALMNTLRSDIDAAEILVGTLISADKSATAIIIGAPLFDQKGDQSSDGSDTYFDRTTLYNEILEIIKPFKSDNDHIYVAGAPIAESILGIHIIEDIVVLVPFSIFIIALILWLACRRLWGVLLGLAEVGACLIWTFGIMGLLNIPIYLPTAVLPVILTTIGLTDEVHIFWYFQRLLANQNEATTHHDQIRQTIGAMVRPITLTSLTTIAAFLSFLTSPIVPIQTFGLFAGIGILFCLFFSITAIPAMLTLVGPNKMKHPCVTKFKGNNNPWLIRRVTQCMMHRKSTLLILLLLTATTGLGITHLIVQDSWIDGFKPTSAFRQATNQINQQLYGVHTLQAHLTTGQSGPPQKSSNDQAEYTFLNHQSLVAIDAFETFVASQPHVGGVLGPCTWFKTLHYFLRKRKEGSYVIPEKFIVLKQLLINLKTARGIHRRRAFMSDDSRRTLISIYLKDANYQETAILMAAIDEYVKVHLSPLDIQLKFSGDVAVSQSMIPAIVHTQVTSLLLAFINAFLICAIFYRSIWNGLLATLPAMMGVLWVFGIMGWVGMPLGIATSMFCCITLGVGVDYSIHYLEVYRKEGCALQAIEKVGPAITIDAVAIAFGFGILIFSQVQSNARFGFLIAIGVTISCLLTLVGLGTILKKRNQTYKQETKRTK